MTTEEHQWNIAIVKDRYHSLQLTFEQAEQVYKFEQDKGVYSADHSFSFWEERDYDYSMFKKVLNPEQLVIFEEWRNNTLESYQRSLVEQDQRNLIEIERHQQLFNYYNEQLLPTFFDNAVIMAFPMFSKDKMKIDFLKAEYKQFLNEQKKRILVSHFRDNRIFAPNQLKASMLRHNLDYLWPEYDHFKSLMDEPTKSIAYYLTNQFRHYFNEYKDIVEKQFKALEVFQRENYSLHYGTTKDGWRREIVIETNLEEQREYTTMCLLLLDKDRYGLAGF